VSLWQTIVAAFSGSKPTACQTCQPSQLLDQASWHSRDNVAVDIVSRLSDAELSALPTGEKARLAEELAAGYVSGKDKAALVKLFRNVNKADFTPPSEVKRQQVLKQTLATDETIVDARSRWASLSTADRKQALQRAADLHADAYALPRKDLEFKDLGDTRSYGYFSPRSGAVVVSDHVDPTTGQSILDDDAEALDTVVHENTHRYQAHLVSELDDGTITSTDDRYNQSRLMRANSGYYAPAARDYQAYRNQPKEAHAWDVGSIAR
jgi:hypothetical protein